MLVWMVRSSLDMVDGLSSGCWRQVTYGLVWMFAEYLC